MCRLQTTGRDGVPRGEARRGERAFVIWPLGTVRRVTRHRALMGVG
jgi:hypothetical protein